MLVEQDLTTKVGWAGRLQARLKRADSRRWKKLWEMPIKNKIPNVGLAHAANRLISDTPKKLKYGAIGIGTTAATDTDTMCESQILTRDKATVSTDTTAVTGDTAKFVSSFTSDTTSYAVTEYATFETASGPPMFNRVTFGAVTLNLNDILEFSYTVQAQEA